MPGPFDPDAPLAAHRGGIYTGNNGNAPYYARHPSINANVTPSPTPMPVQVMNDCAAPVMITSCDPVPVDYEKVVRCDPAGNSVFVISAIDPVTGVPTPTAYNLDGSVYAGAIGGLTECDTPEIESDPVEMCDGGVVNFLRWFIKRDGVITGSVDTDMAGAAYVASGPVTMGACSPALAARNINHEAQNFASGTFAASHDPNGNGAAWVYPGAGKLQSVTVTVLAAGTPASGNTVQVKQGAAGTVVFLVKGQSKTWSVAQDDGNTNEQLDPAFDIQALGDAAFTVAWTEEL